MKVKLCPAIIQLQFLNSCKLPCVSQNRRVIYNYPFFSIATDSIVHVGLDCRTTQLRSLGTRKLVKHNVNDAEYFCSSDNHLDIE